MQIVYSPRYQFDLQGHVWPVEKYQRTYTQLVARHLIAPSQVVEPIAVSWDELALVHTREYLDKIRTENLSPAEIAQLELPFSRELADAFRLMTGGTVVAARRAVGMQSPSQSIVVHLGGGFHHAFANHGEGFCLFNDVAVAVRTVQQAMGIARAAVIDLDVHHGNGTAMIFERDPSVFTFSMHQQLNYPVFKPQSSLDIGLADGTDDDEYLRRLQGALPSIFATSPQLVFYLAGADPFCQDQLGGLALTHEGLRLRDRLVFEAAATSKVPVVTVLAGGYARRLADTVTIHVATVEEAGQSESRPMRQEG